MSNLRNFKENHKVDLQGARNHIKITIKNYSHLEPLVFHKQLDVTSRGLVVAGLHPNYVVSMIAQELKDLGGNKHEWINGRTAKEIISN